MERAFKVNLRGSNVKGAAGTRDADETIAPKGFRNISLRTLTANLATHIGNPPESPEITLTF